MNATIKTATRILDSAMDAKEASVREHKARVAQAMALIAIAEQLAELNEWLKKDYVYER